METINGDLGVDHEDNRCGSLLVDLILRKLKNQIKLIFNLTVNEKILRGMFFSFFDSTIRFEVCKTNAKEFHCKKLFVQINSLT